MAETLNEAAVLGLKASRSANVKSKRAAIYAKVSTNDQDNGL
jgi:predicted site-specific integrase-resolvase